MMPLANGSLQRSLFVRVSWTNRTKAIDIGKTGGDTCFVIYDNSAYSPPVLFRKEKSMKKLIIAAVFLLITAVLLLLAYCYQQSMDMPVVIHTSL